MGVEFDPDFHNRNPPSQVGSGQGSRVRPLAARGSCCGGDWNGLQRLQKCNELLALFGLEIQPEGMARNSSRVRA